MSGKRVKFQIRTEYFSYSFSLYGRTVHVTMYVDLMLTVLESRSAADLTSEQHKTSEEHPCAAEDRGDEDDVSHSR